LSRPPEPVVVVASSEFALKSWPVRRTLEQRLTDDLKFALTRLGLDGFRVEKDAARLVVCGVKDADLAAQACKKVFGVAYAAPAYLLLDASLEDIIRTIRDQAEQRLQNGQSFAVRAHRSTPGPVPRRDVELRGGAEILEAMKDRGVRVDLSNPDITVFVDLVSDDAYVYTERLLGPGGLPPSSQWRMLAVLDSGPLTILAACAMMRRGCAVELFIPLSNTIKGLAAQSQLSLASKLGKLVTRPNYKAFTIEIDELLEKRRGNIQTGTTAWRELVRAAAVKFARAKRFRAVVLGDVAGALEALVPLRFAEVELPIFYPLIGLEKDDLVELSRLADVSVELESQREMDQSLVTSHSIGSLLEVELDDFLVREVRL
jgi:thiamine biosynthesis protein ThiI